MKRNLFGPPPKRKLGGSGRFAQRPAQKVAQQLAASPDARTTCSRSIFLPSFARGDCQVDLTSAGSAIATANVEQVDDLLSAVEFRAMSVSSGPLAFSISDCGSTDE